MWMRLVGLGEVHVQESEVVLMVWSVPAKRYA